MVDSLRRNLEEYCQDNDGDILDFFGDGSIYGETADGGLIVGFGVLGSANLVVYGDCVRCGDCQSSAFSPMLKAAMDDFRNILINC